MRQKRYKCIMVQNCHTKILNQEIKFLSISLLKKVGCTSKFTSFWYGPFLVIKKISDVLCKWKCGRLKFEQVIHVICSKSKHGLTNLILLILKIIVLLMKKVTIAFPIQKSVSRTEEVLTTNRIGRKIKKPVYLLTVYLRFFTVLQITVFSVR